MDIVLETTNSQLLLLLLLLLLLYLSVCAWYFTKEIDWKHASFEEEKVLIQRMHDKPCWTTENPCFKCWPADHVLQPCTAQRCFFRLFGCTKCCFFFPSISERKVAPEGESVEPFEKPADDDDDDSAPQTTRASKSMMVGGETKSSGNNPVFKDRPGSAGSLGSAGGDADAVVSDEEHAEQRLCAENHGCPRALCFDCGAPEPCKPQQVCFKINKGIDYDGDGTIDCAEKFDVRPAPGCIIYALTCCCFCQLCCYGCKNPIEKDKCWKKGAWRYSIDYLRTEACPRCVRAGVYFSSLFSFFPVFSLFSLSRSLSSRSLAVTLAPTSKSARAPRVASGLIHSTSAASSSVRFSLQSFRRFVSFCFTSRSKLSKLWGKRNRSSLISSSRSFKGSCGSLSSA